MRYRLTWKHVGPFAALTVSLLLLAGCNGLTSGGSGGTNPPPPSSTQTTVKVTPASSNVRIGDTAAFTASVTNNSNTAVNWTVNGVAGGNGILGTISSTGTYTAPATIPNPSTVTITATSVADSTASASATITLQNPVPVVSAVSPAIVPVGAFTLTINGSKFIQGAQVTFAGQTLTTTFVSSTQLTATGTATAAQAGSVNVTVVNPNPGSVASASYPLTVSNSTTQTLVAITPPTAAVRLGSSVTFTATVTNNATTTVTWAVNGVTGGNSTVGTINTSGRYTPPSTIPTTAITVTATSTAVTTASATAAVTVQNPIPIVGNVNPTTIPVGANTLTITGSRFVQGAQVMFAGQSLPTTFVSSSQLTATANTTASQVGSQNLTVVNPNPGTAASADYAVTVSNTAPKVTYNAAVRFLEQTTFGPTPSLIAHVQQVGFDGFLNEQFAAPVTALPFDPNFASNTTAQNFFYQNALTGQNQLRQRVAFALQQIIVVSGIKITHDDSTNANMNGLVAWQQMMEKDAFSTYPTLLRDVTLSPVMGNYLDMVNNDKPSTGKNPNENYAREVLQLFSIGLYELNPDGSQKLDGTGQPINSYDQEVIEGYAHLFTGWTYPLKPGDTQRKHNSLNYDGPMVVVETNHDTGTKQILGGVTLPANQTSTQDLDAGLAAIANHPNVGPFIGSQLIRHLVKSNPSPAYINRISTVWADNGSGVRGDLQAVVKAILLDPEARAGDDDSAPTADAGHLREPVLFITNTLRALNVSADPTRLNSYSTNMGQNVLFSPSVFNYFPADYVVSPGVLGPEFGQLNPATAILRANFIADLTLSSIGGTTVDFTNWTTLAADPNQLLTSLNALLLHGQMSQEMRDSILTAVNAVPSNNPSLRAKQALYLVLTSPHYQVAQ